MKDEVALKDIFKFYCASHPKIKKFWKKKSQELVDKYDLDQVNKEESEEEEEVKPIKKNVKSASKEIKLLNKKKQREDTEEESDSESEEKVVVKSSKKSEVATKVNTTNSNGIANVNGNLNVPFKRIDDSIKEILPASLQDNSYETHMNKTGEDYGKQANEKLKFTKGRDFKKEKTKFKNKTAFGGLNISTQVRSIKLDDDSD